PQTRTCATTPLCGDLGTGDHHGNAPSRRGTGTLGRTRGVRSDQLDPAQSLSRRERAHGAVARPGNRRTHGRGNAHTAPGRRGSRGINGLRPPTAYHRVTSSEESRKQHARTKGQPARRAWGSPG